MRIPQMRAGRGGVAFYRPLKLMRRMPFATLPWKCHPGRGAGGVVCLLLARGRIRGELIKSSCFELRKGFSNLGWC